MGNLEGVWEHLLQMTLGSALSCIAPSEHNLAALSRGHGGMACCEPPPSYQGMRKKKKKSRPVINTSCGGGETEMLPQQLVCYCMVQDFCLKHEIKFKEQAGWWW